MKRYIIETDDQYIWTYEVEGTDTVFSCKLLKPHGDKKYWLEESQDYWNWFYGEISNVKGTEIDICFLYMETAQDNFRQFYELMPSSQFSYPAKAVWKVSELIRYFQNFRSTKYEVTYSENPSKFMLKNGKTILVSGMGNFCLTNDATSVNEIKEDLPPGQPSASSPKTRIKVFYPTPEVQKDRPINNVPKKPPTPIIKKENSSTDCIGEDVPTEKVNSEDLQRHIERKTKGQCDTVSFRASVHSTQE